MFPARRLVHFAIATMALAVLVYAAIFLAETRRDLELRDGNNALLEAVLPYREEVAQALQEKRQLPAAAKVPANVRALYANSDGAVIVELAKEFMPGARYIFIPTRMPDGAVQWRCTSERIDGKYLPAACR